MAVFLGTQAYGSSEGYPSKHATDRQVPAWRYDFDKRTVTIKHLGESHRLGSVIRHFDGIFLQATD